MSRPEKKELNIVTKLPDGNKTYGSYELGFNHCHDLFTKHIEDSKPSVDELLLITSDHLSGNVEEGQRIAQAIYKRMEEV